MDEACAAFRAAIECDPAYAEAWCNLGQALQARGEFSAAVEARRKGHELGSKRPDWRFPSAQWVAQAERLLALEGRLSAILKKQDEPRDARERIEFAQVCAVKKHYAAAASFYTAGLPAVEQFPFLRYNAACCAALAGCGKGIDSADLDDVARAGLRKQSVEWLRADLDAWTKRLEGGKDEDRQLVAQTLSHWKGDPDLAEIRNAEQLEKLPTVEQVALRQFWAEVDALLEQTATAAEPIDASE